MTDAYPQVVGIGATVYDTLMVTRRFPDEINKLEGIETKVQGGGSCATALVAARRLGVSAAYIGTIGDDPFGRFMLDDFEKWRSARTMCAACLTEFFHAVVILNMEKSTRTCV